MPGKPSFLKDLDQAAELAALLQDTADTLDQDTADRTGLSRAESARIDQTIARYRRWAAELDPKFGDAPEAARPLHIRPAREHHGEATG